MRRLAVLLLAISLVGAACSDDGPPSVDPPGVDPEVRPTTTEGPEGSTTSTEVENSESIADVAVRLEEVVRFDDAPLAMAVRAGHDDDLFVALQSGTLVRVTASGEPTTILDFSTDVSTDGERGFLGVTFSPEGDRLYTSYTNPEGDSRIDEYLMSGNQVDVASRRQVFAQDQPFPNHNGGNILFGPDRYLYFGLGDGGAAGDPLEAGQDPEQLLGKLIRIDPLGGETPYGVPEDNPFADGREGRPEVWLLGVRNPWRFSFDRATGDLWVADVGQDEIEEVDLLPANERGRGAGRGANLGWNEMEGDQPYEGGTAPADHTPPLLTYSHANGGCSVTGGYVYRGEAIPDLRGAYLYGDLCQGRIRAVLAADGAVVEDRDLGVAVDPDTLVSFGEDAAGELYVLSANGTLNRVVPA